MAALTPILQRLAVHAQVDRETNFLGVLVSFLATGERLGMLARWSPDNEIALDLDRLGRVAWADFGLIRDLRPIGDEHLVRTEFRGFLESHYLVAMAGTRRAVPPREAAHADTVSFVERLRLLLLIRSVEAAEAGVVRDANLKLVCDGVRQVCDQDNYPKWVWLSACRCNDQVTLESWFGKRLVGIESLSRLTSPAVALALGQQVFDLTQDHVAARLVGSNSRTGLPSACTYGSFMAAEVCGALGGTVVQS